MNVLFEESGAFKAGWVRSATESAFQVELASGKRVKVKAAQVLLQFEVPQPAALMAQAAEAAQDIDLDFLWQCAPELEFGFEQLAAEYYGAGPSAVQLASVLMRLHEAPVYFHRKGRGRYRAAPKEILAAALAAIDRKREQQAACDEMVQALVDGHLPAAIAELGVALVAQPDKNGVPWKALSQAASQLQCSPLQLMLMRGGIASAYEWHVKSFLLSHFPRGIGFDPQLPAPPPTPDHWPLASVQAFSIDDSETSEIDDAFSVQGLDSGEPVVTVGIHIAAPAVGLPRDHPLDACARSRLSTVYAPGFKITMLPAQWIEAYSLTAGRTVMALSLYVQVDRASHQLLGFETRIERVCVAQNLRLDALDAHITEAALAAGELDAPFANELVFLHALAKARLTERERVSSKSQTSARTDYTFRVRPGHSDPLALESGTIRIEPRRRGSVLDLIVSELMILANAHWGAWLAQHKVAGVYRSQTYLRGVSQVRMSTTPAPHEGMGLAQYAWASSPLRRYVDLVNQRQLIALVQGRPPAYGLKDAELFALIANFEMVYAAYGEFQSRLERYWCLRWLAQEKKTRVGAMALKGDVIKLDALPWVQRAAGLPELARGQVLELDVLGWDEVELSAHLRVHRVLPVAGDGDAMVPTETPDVQEAAPTCADAVIAQDLLADDTKRVG